MVVAVIALIGRVDDEVVILHGHFVGVGYFFLMICRAVEMLVMLYRYRYRGAGDSPALHESGIHVG